MYTLAWSESFRRGFKKATRKNAVLQDKIFTALTKLSQNPFDPLLKTHKLHGKLSGLWACQVEYDCRIVFAFETVQRNETVFVLVDIG
jgi:addiction module RelE/StbE family toxin